MFLALRDIRFAKGRFALMGGVVALITLLLVMLSGLTAGLGDQSTSAIAKLGTGTGGASKPVDTIVFGAPGAGEPKASYTESAVTAAQLDVWKRVPGVDAAGAVGISQARLQAGGSGSAAGGTANVAVFGVAADGGLAPAAVAPGTVVVGSTVARDLELTVGDTASVGGSDLTVSGVVEDQWYSHTSVVWTALPDWSRLAHITDPQQLGTVLAVSYRDGSSVDESAANAAARTVTASRTDSFQALGSFKSENGSLMLMQAFLYGISALVIVAFLTVWTVQRTRDVAVLKALGGSVSYVLRDALTQAAIVLLAGAGAGGALGILGGSFAAQAAPFLLTPATTLLPVLGIIVLGLAGAALAVRRVTKVDALIALGGN
ncbi:putative ABC transporter permease protein [Arthrobacter globiformis NBRC 12137]|uniref:Putative ABC transporter permease protein n=1 Tax=Arthrobacter globiformis (strain ATCC 8010 / DSM 20124 / JCM 1332 / NBRC 12137 / NCIMB 8907 / NRRL B-2979 / 168) TaxID=1077972 RepID=H0QTT1_ARTG1|nr:ABC transporter permease [Arthrobacter globiformis]GAB16232.1 putative ABC transporter permease protein [Arthrobacter globiformis NBRC 12137]